MPDERIKTMSTAYEEFKAQFWQEPRNWTNFTIQLAKQRDLVSLKILEKVYLDPGCPLSLIELQQMLANITRNKMTIWNHVKKLEAVDLAPRWKSSMSSFGGPLRLWLCCAFLKYARYDGVGAPCQRRTWLAD